MRADRHIASVAMICAGVSSANCSSDRLPLLLTA
jgi:hypothetical protein